MRANYWEKASIVGQIVVITLLLFSDIAAPATAKGHTIWQIVEAVLCFKVPARNTTVFDAAIDIQGIYRGGYAVPLRVINDLGNDGRQVLAAVIGVANWSQDCVRRFIRVMQFTLPSGVTDYLRETKFNLWLSE